MKKVIVFLLVAVMMGAMCSCDNVEDNEEIIPQESVSAKELYSKIFMYHSVERTGERQSEEVQISFDWTENGVTIDRKSTKMSTSRVEVVFDAEKRPATITTTNTSEGMTSQQKVELTYPSAHQVKMYTTYDGEHPSTVIYDFDEKGNMIRWEQNGWIKTYEYDDRGNCIRQVVDYSDERPSNEHTTTYTYDESGKILFAVETNNQNNHEQQRHYYYYPNGNVMFIHYVSSTGDVNTVFKPYNPKDLTWSNAMMATGGYQQYEVEKDDRGYITKVTRKQEQSDEVATAYFEYDQRGNLIKKTDFDGKTTKWEFDDQNRLSKLYGKDVIRYTYDQLGRLIETSRTNKDGSTESDFIYYHESGMTAQRQMVGRYLDGEEHVTRVKTLVISYVENEKNHVNPQWAAFFAENFLKVM